MKNNYVVLIAKDNNYLDSVKYSFKNVIELDRTLTIEKRDELVKKIEKYKEVILVDYLFVYRYLMQTLDKNFKMIITYDISSLALIDYKLSYKTLQEFYDRKLITSIACIDEDFYQLLKKAKYNVKRLLLDVDIKFKTKNNNEIGIIGIDYNPLENYYNELTALKLTSYDSVNLYGKTNTTKEFTDFFDIKCNIKENYLDVIKNSSLVLYCAFANISLEKILICLDNNIPILVGNTTLFDKYKTLKENLVLNSDDDVNEIALRINQIKENKEVIFKDYKKFREKYKSYSKKTIEKFIES